MHVVSRKMVASIGWVVVAGMGDRLWISIARVVVPGAQGRRVVVAVAKGGR